MWRRRPTRRNPQGCPSLPSWKRSCRTEACAGVGGHQASGAGVDGAGLALSVLTRVRCAARLSQQGPWSLQSLGRSACSCEVVLAERALVPAKQRVRRSNLRLHAPKEFSIAAVRGCVSQGRLQSGKGSSPCEPGKSALVSSYGCEGVCNIWPKEACWSHRKAAAADLHAWCFVLFAVAITEQFAVVEPLSVLHCVCLGLLVDLNKHLHVYAASSCSARHSIFMCA